MPGVRVLAMGSSSGQRSIFESGNANGQAFSRERLDRVNSRRVQVRGAAGIRWSEAAAPPGR